MYPMYTLMKHRRRELICPVFTMGNLRRRGQVIAQELNGILGTSGLMLLIQLVFAYTVCVLCYFDYSSYVHPEVAYILSPERLLLRVNIMITPER